MSDSLDGIPTPLLTGVFSHARAIHKLLHEFVTENEFVGVSSYDAIKQELDYLKSDLEQVGELIPELPETIRVELKAVAEIVNDALCNISFADVCQSFLESDIDAHGKRGWHEVVRLKNPPAIGWAKPAADDDGAGAGAGEGDSPEGEKDLPLSVNKQDILQALFLKGAIDSDHRTTAEEVAIAVAGPTADVNAFKGPLSELVEDELLKSKTGRGGGSWLTQAGIDRAKKP